MPSQRYVQVYTDSANKTLHTALQNHRSVAMATNKNRAKEASYIRLAMSDHSMSTIAYSVDIYVGVPPPQQKQQQRSTAVKGKQKPGLCVGNNNDCDHQERSNTYSSVNVNSDDLVTEMFGRCLVDPVSQTYDWSSPYGAPMLSYRFIVLPSEVLMRMGPNIAVYITDIVHRCKQEGCRRLEIVVLANPSLLGSSSSSNKNPKKQSNGKDVNININSPSVFDQMLRTLVHELALWINIHSSSSFPPSPLRQKQRGGEKSHEDENSSDFLFMRKLHLSVLTLTNDAVVAERILHTAFYISLNKEHNKRSEIQTGLKKKQNNDLDLHRLYMNCLCEVPSISDRRAAIIASTFPTMYTLMRAIEAKDGSFEAALSSSSRTFQEHVPVPNLHPINSISQSEVGSGSSTTTGISVPNGPTPVALGSAIAGVLSAVIATPYAPDAEDKHLKMERLSLLSMFNIKSLITCSQIQDQEDLGEGNVSVNGRHQDIEAEKVMSDRITMRDFSVGDNGLVIMARDDSNGGKDDYFQEEFSLCDEYEIDSPFFDRREATNSNFPKCDVLNSDDGQRLFFFDESDKNKNKKYSKEYSGDEVITTMNTNNAIVKVPRGNSTAVDVCNYSTPRLSPCHASDNNNNNRISSSFIANRPSPQKQQYTITTDDISSSNPFKDVPETQETKTNDNDSFENFGLTPIRSKEACLSLSATGNIADNNNISFGEMDNEDNDDDDKRSVDTVPMDMTRPSSVLSNKMRRRDNNNNNNNINAPGRIRSRSSEEGNFLDIGQSEQTQRSDASSLHNITINNYNNYNDNNTTMRRRIDSTGKENAAFFSSRYLLNAKARNPRGDNALPSQPVIIELDSP